MLDNQAMQEEKRRIDAEIHAKVNQVRLDEQKRLNDEKQRLLAE